MLRQFACVCTLLLGYAPFVYSANSEMYFLKYGHMSCPNETDVASLASAKGEIELKSQVIGKIFTGACTAAALPMMKIESVTEKTTSNGGTYYCFKVVDLDVVNDQIECAPSFFVTTLTQELARRNGDYKIQAQASQAVRATCTEGGTVFLFNKDGTWWRTSQVIPIKTTEFTEVKLTGISIEQAIRDGCRGNDAR